MPLLSAVQSRVAVACVLPASLGHPGATLREVAQMLGLSQARARSIQDEVFQRLRTEPTLARHFVCLSRGLRTGCSVAVVRTAAEVLDGAAQADYLVGTLAPATSPHGPLDPATCQALLTHPERAVRVAALRTLGHGPGVGTGVKTDAVSPEDAEARADPAARAIARRRGP